MFHVGHCSPTATANNWEGFASTLRDGTNWDRKFPYVTPVFRQQSAVFEAGLINPRQEASPGDCVSTQRAA